MSKMPLIASIYNPQNQTKERLIDSFVVRIKTFEKLFKEIEEAKMEVSEQHHLIIGKRGLGKTTLLLRMAYEIEQTPKLNTWLIPVVFNEEEYSIRKLYKFWIRIAELLEEKEDLFYGIPAEMDDLSNQYTDDAAYEKAIFEILTAALKKHHKKIILFIDNVGEMF
ncbi:MAG: ATPase, partial [Saprospiraceae bacterium]